MTFQGPPPDSDRGFDGPSYPFYISWHAQGSAEYMIQPATFSLRQSGSGNPPQPTEALAQGTVWDIENIETGWQSWPSGGAKEWRSNPTPAQPLPYPGPGFIEGLKIPMALDQNTIACWDQAAVGAWRGFCQIAAVIAQQAPQNPGLYPVIRIVGATLTATGKNSTQVPNFEIVQWVPQPACFAPQAQPAPQAPVQGFEQHPAPQQPPAAPAPVAAPPAPATATAPQWGAPTPAAAPAAPAPTAPSAGVPPAGVWN